MQVEFHSQTVGDVAVFCRVASLADAPVVLLLHRFPTASHMFRDLIPELATTDRVIAPTCRGLATPRHLHAGPEGTPDGAAASC